MSYSLHRHFLPILLLMIVLLIALLPSTPAPLGPGQVEAARDFLPLTWSSTERAYTNIVAWGDIDNDGDLDLAVGGSSPSVRLYRNDSGILTSNAIWSSIDSNNTTSIAWGDVDNDGDLDLAVGGSSPSVRLYRNDSGILTSNAIWSSIDNGNITSIAWGDVDGDGDLDLAVGTATPSDSSCFCIPPPRPLVMLYQNNSGTLTANSVWSTQELGNGKSIAWGDVDNDGDLDMAVAKSRRYDDYGCHCYLDPPGSSVLLYRNNGGVLTPNTVWATDQFEDAISAAWGDADGDGDLDLAIGGVGSANPSSSIVIYQNDSGVLTANSLWFTTEIANIISIAWGDIDSDSDLDLIVGNGNSPVRLYKNNGVMGVSFSADWSAYSPNDSTIQSIALGDIDGDADLDLAVGSYESPIRMYRNESGVLTSNAVWAPTDGIGGRGALGDIDDDGDLDLILANSFLFDSTCGCYRSNQPARLYRNNGGVLTSNAVWSPSDLGEGNPAWGDVDGDGDLDLALGRQLYRNDNGVLTSSAVWSPIDIVQGDPQWSADAEAWGDEAAWGDVDSDGDLDLVITTSPAGPQLYRNDNGTLTNRAIWSALDIPNSYLYNINSVWGDVDNDGDLDLVAGTRLYRNNDGILTTQAVWSVYSNTSHAFVALGDVDSDGDLDLIVGDINTSLYRNDDGMFTTNSIWSGIPVGWSISTAWADSDGDGDLDVSFSHGTSSLYRNEKTTINPNAAWSSTDFSGLLYYDRVAWGDVDTDGDLDLIGANGLYHNGTAGISGLPSSMPVINIRRPDRADPNGTSNAGFFSAARIHSGRTITIPYTLRDAQSRPIRAIHAEYSLNGGGNWKPAIPASGTVTTNLATSPAGANYTFTWDTFASSVSGQSDNVVVRLVAYPSNTTVENGTPLFMRPYSSATTYPFRVRGTQVRVVDQAGVPQRQAIVYRLPADRSQPVGLLAPGPNSLAFTTSPNGYLAGRSPLAVGDTLVALAPVPPAQLPAAMQPFSNTVDLYATNLTYTQSPTGLQFQGKVIQASGVQTTTVSLNRPLALINLIVSLEWDARNDTRYMTQLRYNLQRASELLFDATNGQAALGQVHVFFGKENWDNAHIRIYASNRVRPSAVIGGVADMPFTTTYNVAGQPSQVNYGPGQVFMGATWNRYGDAGTNLADDWARVLVHELGHFVMFLDDHYIGRTGSTLAPVEYAACPGLMHDPYTSIELHPSSSWRDPSRSPNCAATLADQELGQSDWATLQRHYPFLNAPTGVFGAADSIGPVTLSVPFTELYEYEPLTPTITLETSIFYTIDEATGQRVQMGPRSRAFLFQDDTSDSDSLPNNRLVPLGRTTLDQVLARGARVGDRVCVMEDRQQWGGCTAITAGAEQLFINHWGTNGRPAWQPDIAVTPVTSTTLQIQIGNLAAGQTIQAALYPVENPQDGLIWPAPISLNPSSTGYSGSFNLPASLSSGFVHVWVANEQPRRESIVQFTMDGNAGVGARTTGGGGARTTGGVGARTTGGVGARTTGGVGARTTGGVGARTTGGTFIRTGNAAIATSEADVLFEDPDLSFAVGQFLLLQQIASPPPPPSGTTFVGTAYRFAVSSTNPPIIGPRAAVSFGYLGSEVPVGEEDGIRIYYYNPSNPSTGWQLLNETRVDTYHNLASSSYRGPGIYALMSSLVTELTPGWNNIGYTSQVSRKVPDIMAPVTSTYSSVYHYNPRNPADPWELYSPGTPTWVNNLDCMQFGQGYWVYSTSVTTSTLRIRGSLDPGEVTGCEGVDSMLAGPSVAPQALGPAVPPGTFYGTVTSSPMLSVEPGLLVVARIGSTICGQGTTMNIDGQVVYRVHVSAATTDAPDCGLPGRLVRFEISGIPTAGGWWNNAIIQKLDLIPGIGFQLFLPTVVR